MLAGPTEARFGANGDVHPVQHLMATAAGWGGNPAEAAVYVLVYPEANDGKTVHKLTAKDVPVDGFWSISVYNAKGYFEKNALDSYSLNNLTAKPNADGSYPVQAAATRRTRPTACARRRAGTTSCACIGRARKFSTAPGSSRSSSR